MATPGTSGCRDTNDDVVDLHFFAVLFRSTAVHHQEMRGLPERDQRVMPGVAPIVHALSPGTQECTNTLADRPRALVRDDDQKRAAVERIETLTGQGMPLERAHVQ